MTWNLALFVEKMCINQRSHSNGHPPYKLTEAERRLRPGIGPLLWRSRIALFVALNLCVAVSPASEFRGLWVDAFGPGFFNAAQVKKLVQDCRKYNFNAVLVQMRRRADAFYNSNYDPRTTIIGTNFDALAEIIQQCHTGTPRIEVHCWVVSHYIWAWHKPPTQPDHVFNRHPE